MTISSSMLDEKHSFHPSIDGLRAISVLAVLIYHVDPRVLSGGYLGVDVFFVISGFLITRSILHDFHAGAFSIGKFYNRRIRRILPVLFLTVASILPLAFLAFTPAKLVSFVESVIAVVFFSSNLYFWRKTDYFAEDADFLPLIHTWSLGVEEQFYIAYPFFLLFIWKRAPKYILPIIGAIAFVSFSTAIQTVDLYRFATFYSLPTRAWELLAGASVACFVARYTAPKTNFLTDMMCLLGLGLIIFPFFLFDDTYTATIPSLIPILGTCLVIVFAGCGTLVNRLLELKVLKLVGLCSFSIYLMHHVFLSFARIFSGANLEISTSVLIACLSILAGYLSYKYIENPFRDSNFISNKKLYLFLGFSAGYIISVSILTIYANGFLFWFDKVHYNNLKHEFTAAEYVTKNFNRHLMKDFPNNNFRQNLLIVGDSYAQDMVNAFFESSLAGSFELSTVLISSLCGNVWLDSDDLNLVPPKTKISCKNEPRYTKKTQDLIKQADQVWLVSKWRPWHVKFLPQTVKNIQSLNKATTVRVFGRKYWGRFNYMNFTGLTNDELAAISANLLSNDPWHIDINMAVKGAVKSNFFDLDEVVCDPDYNCNLFNTKGQLITYDGAHLTPWGAEVFGRHLSQLSRE